MIINEYRTSKFKAYRSEIDSNKVLLESDLKKIQKNQPVVSTSVSNEVSSARIIISEQKKRTIIVGISLAIIISILIILLVITITK